MGALSLHPYFITRISSAIVGWQYCSPEAVLMRSFWFDPYLWVHLAGIAAVPLFLELCLLGLAVGEPLFPAWFELLFVGAIGILPILWMQWQRPFSIFSLVLLALKPAQLTEDQRRILQRFKTPLNRILAVLSAGAMAWLLWWLYQIAPTVSPTLFLGISREMALLIAAIGCLGSNLFLQVPVSVLSVLLTNDNTFATTSPYPSERIAQDFTIPGIRVGKILPPLLRSLPPTVSPTPPPAPIAKPTPAAATPSVAPSPEAPAIPPPASPSATETPKAESSFEFNNPFHDAAEMENLEDETIAASTQILESPSEQLSEQPSESKQFQLTQLDESYEVVEEIVVPPALPASLAKAETNERQSRAMPDEPAIDSASIQEETNFDSIQPFPEQAVEAKQSIELEQPFEPEQPIEIIEDVTIVETFDLDPSDLDSSNESEPDTTQLETEAREPQQETERPNSDPWD